MSEGIQITVRDLETGDEEKMVIMDDYVIITAGTCYLAHTTAHRNGTHSLTIKGRKPDAVTQKVILGKRDE